MKLCFPLRSKTIIYFHIYMILDFSYNIYKCVSACLHKTVNKVVFLVKSDEIPTQKGEHSCKCTELSL